MKGFLLNLKQLESISRGRFVFDEPANTLSRVSGLEVISHTISKHTRLRRLASVVHLEELGLGLLPSGHRDVTSPESFDFSLLLQFPRLRRLIRLGTDNRTIGLTPSSVESTVSQGTTLGDVLPQLTQVTHPTFRGGDHHAAKVEQLSHLKHLKIGYRFKIFDWIRSLQSFRTLKIKAPSRGCDFAGIGDLVGLEELYLEQADWECGDASPLAFLGQLVNARILRIRVSPFHDFGVLRGMRSLKTLKISGSCWTTPATSTETLAEFTQLRELRLSGIWMTDGAPLTRLPRLR